MSKCTVSMAGSKERYIEFCRTTPVPLQFQPWWLDAVCGSEQWGAAVAETGRGGGVLPYFRCRRWGMPVVQLPPLTAYAGPWLQLPAAKSLPSYKKLALEHRLLTELIGQLPQTVFFHQTFRPEIRNILPFCWAGFHQTVRYTYTLPATGKLSALHAGLKNTLRTDLRRAEQELEIRPEHDPEVLFRLNALSYARKGLRQPYAAAVFGRLHQALAQRSRSAGFVAVARKSQTAVAGLFIVSDERQAGVLLAGLDPACRNPGALHSLYWQAICYCSERGLALDFEGSMDRGIERVFRAFGGRLTPYFRVWRAANKWLDLWRR